MKWRKNKDKPLEVIKCKCGYCNQKENVDRYGTCRLCGATLDDKAKFEYEMYCRLKLWRKRT